MTFKEQLEIAIRKRKAQSKVIDREELDRRHREINAPGYVNRMFGSMNSADMPKYNPGK